MNEMIIKLYDSNNAKDVQRTNQTFADNIFTSQREEKTQKQKQQTTQFSKGT